MLSHSRYGKGANAHTVCDLFSTERGRMKEMIKLPKYTFYSRIFQWHSITYRIVESISLRFPFKNHWTHFAKNSDTSHQQIWCDISFFFSSLLCPFQLKMRSRYSADSQWIININGRVRQVERAIGNVCRRSLSMKPISRAINFKRGIPRNNSNKKFRDLRLHTWRARCASRWRWFFVLGDTRIDKYVKRTLVSQWKTRVLQLVSFARELQVHRYTMNVICIGRTC